MEEKPTVYSKDIPLNTDENIKKYQLTLSQTMRLNQFIKNLYRCQKFSDVTLCVQTASEVELLSSHRFVLASSSDYFANMFDKLRTSTNSTPFLIVLPPEITVNAMNCILRYMYTGEVNTSECLQHEWLRAGKTLGVKGIEDKWIPKIQSTVVIESSVDVTTEDDDLVVEEPETLLQVDFPTTRSPASRLKPKRQPAASPKSTRTAKRPCEQLRAPPSNKPKDSRRSKAVQLPKFEVVSVPEIVATMSDEEDEEVKHGLPLADDINNVSGDNLTQPKIISILKNGELVSAYCCRICNKIFLENEHWKQHVDTTHGNIDIPLKAGKLNETKSTLICNVCNLSFKFIKEWMEHVRTRHKA